MNGAIRLAYRAAGQLARAAAVITPDGTAKWRQALRARRGIRRRYATWAPQRDPSKPLIWLHASSVGEGLQARAVLDVLRERHPEAQFAYTYFSPSAQSFAASLGAHFTDYLPFDTVGDARAALDALRPSVLVFSKADVWPVLVHEAAVRDVGLALVSATLPPLSSRRGMAGRLLQEAYAQLDRVGAVSAADAERLVSLGVRRECLTITGDTRYDQVWRRARGTDRASALLSPLVSPRPTLVAGSTWPGDEAVLLDAWLAVRRDVRDARLIIAPHEPTPEHLAPVSDWALTHGLALAKLDAVDVASADVVLVDRVGVLGDLYALADAAFVGGGFHDAGLHSVLEPAAFGAPVAFGPQHQNSRDAALLIDAGGGDSVSTVDETIELLLLWLGDPGARRSAGDAARGLVESGLGAADRSADMVLGLIRA